MSESERELMQNLVVPRPIWTPLAGPQIEAYLSPADELFYGGAAGGGKTDLLLGLALTGHRRSIIFRREYPQLKAIIDRGNEIIGAAGRFNGQDHVWRMADGRLVELGAVQFDADVQKYQGRPHDLKGFDEITHFSESQYRFLNGWKRTADPTQRTRTVVTGNPPTNAEGRWVISYWGPWLDDRHPHPAQAGELRWYAMIDGEDTEITGPEPIMHKGELIVPQSRTFIPARVEDNPYYMATDYRSQLQALPEPLRSQMLMGDFAAGVEDDPWQVIPTAWVHAAMERWKGRTRPELPMTALGVDVARGGKDQTVLSARYGNWFSPLDVYPGQATPNGPAVAALALAAVGDSQAVIGVDVIGVGASVYDTLIGKATVYGINFAEGSSALDRSGRLSFVNLRAEAYWKLREALDPQTGDGLALPDDPALLADLCTPRWTMRVSGIQVESKEDIIKRLGHSPDRGDAVALCYHAMHALPSEAMLMDVVRQW